MAADQPILVDANGEVPEDAEVAEKVAQFADSLEGIAELEEALKSMRAENAVLDAWFRDRGLKVGDRFYAGDGRLLVMTPPKRRASQTVNKKAATAYSEQLLDMGIGRMAYIAPTAEIVRAESARIIAAGITLEEILPPVVESGIGQLEIVKEAA